MKENSPLPLRDREEPKAPGYGVHISWLLHLFTVIPAKAGIHLFNNVSDEVDPGFRRGDEKKDRKINASRNV